MKQLKRVSGKIMALIICAMLILSVIPVSVITAFAETNDEMGVLSGITAGGTLEGENGEAASITYSDASLVWSKADPSVGRMTDGWWIGVKMEAPANLTTKENFEGVTYQRLGNDGNYVTKNFWDVKDSKDGDTVHFLNMWVLVNEQHLNEALSLGTNVVYDYHFNWNPGKEGNEQSVKIIIKPDEIKLNKDNAQVYPTTDGNGKVEALTDGLTVKNANSNFVEVVYTSDVTMKWQAKDEAAGRGQDGWWAGMKITAPDTLQVESDFEGVTYQRKDGNTWTADKSFWNAKDSKPEDTTHFLTMWGLINEAILENAKAKGENGTANYTYRFDWNKDGVYEQTVVLKINPQYITLLDESNTQVYPDITAPVISEITGNPTEWVNTDVTLTVIATDTNAISYSIDEGVKWQTDNKFTITENKDYSISVKDAAGNISKQTVTVDKIDKTKPSVAVKLDPDALKPDGSWTKDEITVTMTATENESGVKEYLVDGNSQTANTFKITDANEHKVQVVDNAGNKSAEVIFAAKYDATAPVINEIAGNPTEWTKNDATLTVSATDTGCNGMQYKLDSGEWQAENQFTITENKDYTIYVKDLLGNETSQVISVTKIDKTKPTVSDYSATTEEWTNKDVVITGKFADNSNDTITAFYKIGAGEWQPLTLDAENKFEITVTEECNTTYCFKALDKAGNEFETAAKTIIIDKTPANLTVNAVPTVWKNEQIDVTGTVSDLASGIDTVKYSINSTNGVVDSGDVTITGSDYAFTTNVDKSGVYTYTITAVDKAGNSIDVTTGEVKIDLVDPIVNKVTPSPEDWTNEVVTVTVDVADADSGIEKVYYKKDGGAETEITATEGVYSFVIPNAENDNFEYDIYCKDNSGRVSAVSKYTSKIDVTAPTKPVIKYSKSIVGKFLETITFGLYNSDVTVTITSSDDLSGLKEIVYFKGEEEIHETPVDNKVEFTVKPDFKGKITAVAYDNAGNNSEEQVNGTDIENKEIGGVIADATAPNVDTAVADITDWTNGDVVVTGTVSDNLSGVKNVYWKQGIDGDEKPATVNDKGSYNFTVEKRDYIGHIYIGCYDNAGNKADEKHVAVEMDITAPKVDTGVANPDTWTNENVIITGTVSDEIVNDAQSKVVAVEYSYNNSDTLDAEFNSADNTYKIDIPEVDYDGDVTIWCLDDAGNISEDITVDVHMDITAPKVDTGIAESAEWTNENVIISGKVSDETVNYSVSGVASVEYFDTDGTKKPAKTFDATTGEYTIEIEKTDYFNDIVVWCTDNAGNKSEDFKVAVKMDITAPDAPTITYEQKVIDTVLETITFGFYKAEVTAVITSDDNFDSADNTLKAIKYEYVGTKAKYDATLVSKNETKNVDVNNAITVTIPAEFKGVLKAKAIDKAGNESAWTDEANANDKNDNPVVLGGVVVDNTDPNRSVSYTPDRIVDAESLLDKETYVEGDNSILYYKGDAKVTFTVTEGNFYAEDIKLYLSKDNGEAQPITVTDWSNNGDKWTGTYTISGDGDYAVTMQYTDRSGNKMVDYTSPRIVIDTDAPIVTVDYANKKADAINILKDSDGNDRQYFYDDQSAVITIQEKNFRADDVKINVKAKDLVGNNINVGTLTFDNNGNVVNYYNEGAAPESWTPYDANFRRDDNTYQMVITYPADANYTFDIEYTDLATNDAVDYAPDYFTVDKTAPTNLKVDYETNVFENVLEHITFGYYQAKMEVTISADDDVAGVHHYVYSYIKNSGVSDVNAELINEAIEAAEITRSGKTFTTTFTIPKLDLTANTQFNGFVEFAAYDRSENLSETLTDKNNVIVVDNIKPTATVTFNDPVQKVNDVSYYAGDINATVVITEANFFAEDVNITVTKDGAVYPVSVKWTDNSVDVHTGTFTLTEDGDYVVSVDYTDKSENEMTPFVSNQLTIDTVDPVITVSDVKHQSANNQETISLTVSVTDTNIALESFKPELKVVVKKDNGDGTYSYVTQNVDLGASRTTVNANGETVHSYTISNIATDGYYSLVCTAVDYANHSVSIIRSQNNVGGSAEVETVNFSVNRDGSVFWIETEHNDKYTGETFKDALDGAYANDKVTIKLHEVNVDKVDENADKKTVFTLNDGSESEDIVLNDSNYEKNTLIGAGGWYENIYTLNNDNFDQDGVYSFNIITYDAATNSNVNTKEEAGTISFTLDRTKPVITANVKTDQRINDTQFPVEFKITETNLNAETITVKLRDRNGKIVKTDVKDLGNNEYKFTVEDGLNYSFEVTATDLAGNESEILKVDRFTVSTNILVLWYANTPLFWGSIGGVVLVACAIVFFILYKKKKNQEN